ncbi:unnamed protein product, partial [Rotaria sp. Silwood2]
MLCIFSIYVYCIFYFRLNLLTLEFAIHAIQLKNERLFSLPDCYHFSVKVTFDNNARTGKIRQHLNSDAKFRTFLFITIISFILCIRSLWFGHHLCKEIRLYYSLARTQEKPLAWSELQIFYSFWYFLMIITDLMVIPGTIIKIGILFK